MTSFLLIVWGISAAIAWEAQAEALTGNQRRWDAITIGSLVPVYNTLLAWSYVRDAFRKMKG